MKTFRKICWVFCILMALTLHILPALVWAGVAIYLGQRLEARKKKEEELEKWRNS